MNFEFFGEEYRYTFDGIEYVLRLCADIDTPPPWEGQDGFGPVSGWVSRKKWPGERILASMEDMALYYDFAEAVRLALRDGWDAAPYAAPGETEGQRAERAAEADFKRLYDWCHGRWNYVGLVLRRREDVERCACCAPWESVWGVESDSGEEYFRTIAKDLASELEANNSV